MQGRDVADELRLAAKIALAGTLACHQTLLVAAALAGGGALGIVLRVGQRLNVQPAVSAIFMLGVAGSTGAGVARVWESAIGAAFTIPVSALLWPPDPLRELEARIERLRQLLADVVGPLSAG